ncbi:oxalyl-CoA decarboxylase [Serinibacter salmoneus]|uniref:Oxalyl-CoA decarboxylase n=1 Tax=Serinibacter salmoneus TaxID=556530 RepID=A0A2A9CZC6_9MICO|nr:oxalyl-CoA decarboxylase [Serinibacter salmoneus]PFG18970.1 oxalyl-CoA decarboxylase [Serinibacter salmoneus]
MTLQNESAQTNGFNVVIDALQANGVETMYGVVGIPVTDLARLAQVRGMRYLGFRHEGPAGTAAAAAGYLTGKPGVALTVSAPGFLNGLVSLAAATVNCFPMILISGSSEREIVDLSRGDYEELDQYNAAKPYAKAAYRVDRPEDIGLAVARAVRTATSGRPGGVYLDLPAKTLSALIDAEKAAASVFTVTDPAPAQLPADDAVARAVDVIAAGKKPLIIFGKGAAYAKAEQEALELVEATGIPFLPMSMAKGLIPDTHEASVAAARSLALKEADVVILVGARLNWLLSHGEAPHFNPDARFVQVEIDATEFDSNQPVAAPLAGDIVSVLGKLTPALRAAGVQADGDWRAELATKREANAAKMAASLQAPHTPMGYFGALGVLKKAIDAEPDTYLVSEGANTLDIGRNVIDIHLPRHRLDTGTWGVMGVGMGYAIAAAVETGRPVIALEGDSAFGFSGMEVETICRYRLPIVVVILNNGGVYKGDGVNTHGSDPAPTVLDLQARYDMLATAFGGTGYHVTTPAELDEALTAALAAGTPTVINAVIDPTLGTESGHLTNLNPATAIPTK